MSINLFVHTRRCSKNNPKLLYLMNSQHFREIIHIEGNKKRSILRNIVKDVLAVFYSFNLLVIGHVNLVKSQNLFGSTGRN